MPDDDDGWGGTVDEGWAGPGQPSPPAGPPGAPAGPPRGRPTPGPSETRGPFYQPPPAPPGAGQRPGRTRLYVGVAVAVVVAATVLVVVLVSSGGSSSPTRHANSSIPATHSASVSVTAHSGGSTRLLDGVPFNSGCTEAPKSTYDTSSVVDQVVCTGSDVQSTAAALGVSYAEFPDQASLDSWYNDTILQKNGIQQNAGDCTNGQTVTTQGGAIYCEGTFTTATGASARQTVVQAPAGVNLTNGPNSSSADCPNSAYTLLAFTLPANHVGVIALTCSSTADAGNGLESALTSGAFDLH